ncbi:hypothetical protein D3C79_806590 [compost metagenome]
MYVLFDISFTFQLHPHTFQRLRQLRQLVAAHFWQRHAFALRYAIGIVHQSANRTVDPPDETQPDQQGNTQQQRTGPQNAPLAALDHRRHAAVRFTYAEHADNLALFQHRRGDVHHRAVFILRVAARTACAILSAQRQINVIPA